MNPYINQGNQNNPYLQNAYNQQNFMGNLPPEMQSMQFDQQNNPTIMANMMTKRQMYGQPQAQAQQQQLPFNSPGGSSNPSVTGSPALSNMQSPQQRQPGIMNSQQPMMQQSPPQQQWMNKQQQMPLMGMQQMDPQQRQQFLMMQQQQMLRKQQQQLFQQPQLPTQLPQTQPPSQPMTIPSNSMSPKTNHTGSPIPPVESIDADINTKRVDAILSLNIEIIRLCIESQRIGSNLEPNIGLYQAKLQSNLTYLATMADVSMAKPGEDYKAPPPPDFSSLPPPQSDIGKKIHELYNIAQKLFEDQHKNSNSPQSQSQSPSLQRNSQQQQLLRQQAAAMRQQQQQQFLRNTNKSGSNSANSSATGTPNIPVNGIPSNNMDPQSVLRQNAQTMMQQQQLRQQQQQQMMMMSSPTNSNPSMSGFSPSPNTSLPSAQQMSPSDLLAANGMINPTNTMMNNVMLNPNNIMMNNMYNGNTMEDSNNYNVMMMMQRLQQQQQHQ